MVVVFLRVKVVVVVVFVFVLAGVELGSVEGEEDEEVW